jgi:hypothetical protein
MKSDAVERRNWNKRPLRSHFRLLLSELARHSGVLP